ncbi:MAG: flagellin, partial [Hyphomicrobium sp.]
LSQERTALATERMSIQMDIISTHVGKLESVDPAEVSVRVTALMTQIETSYALTARLHQLSLVNYL